MIETIRLQKFRSYTDELFEFRNGVNIIVGPNASGKTNLLEALLVIARGSSYRVKDIDLIGFEAPWARLDAVTGNGDTRTLKLAREPASKRYELDAKVFQRLSLQHTLPVVLFEPNHLRLLTGGPDRRREYIDDILEHTLTGYGGLRRQYKRTLAQRNALLKQPTTPSAAQLFPWDIRLSQLAGQIVRARSELLQAIGEKLPTLYAELSRTKTTISLLYDARWPSESYESQLLKKLESSFELDRMRGFTGNGPHRDDINVQFNGYPASDSASRGETRTLVLALKIMELQLLAAAREQTPLLLLDDVFSELDGARRRTLTEHLRDYQTFITTTDADIVLEHFSETCQVISLDGR
jgi:DNA replication and repair protein RecF